MDDRRFFASLHQRGRYLQSGALREVAARSKRDATDASRQLIGYFAERLSHRFFVGLDELPALAQRVSAEMPHWRKHTIQTAHEFLHDGLPIYALTAPPLRSGFPWEAPVPANGDVLYALRPQRFGFLPRIALAALYGAPVLPQIDVILEDWTRFISSTRSSLPYYSNLVVIQRAAAVTWAWAFIAASPAADSEVGVRVLFSLLKILSADASHLFPRTGESQPNNHLLADHFGTWYMSALFPEFIEQRDTEQRYGESFLRELDRQTLPDGGGFEHALHYQELACEMACARLLLARRSGQELPAGAVERIKAMLRLQAELGGGDGYPPMVGDGTEDPLFPVGADRAGSSSWREIHRAVFDPDFPAGRRDHPTAELAFWLLGGKMPPARPRSMTARMTAFPHAGFHVFSDEQLSSTMVLRTGPSHGDRLHAGHMHADLLSVFLTVEGVPIILDSGTYTYQYRRAAHLDEPGWRDYFMGPAAHNGLCIAGVDPLGELCADFRGTRCQTRVRTLGAASHAIAAWTAAVVQSGSPYDGYRRDLIHVPGHYWLICDRLGEATPLDSARYGFQLNPGAEIHDLDASTLTVSCLRSHVVIASSAGLMGPQILNGSRDPIGGWVSPRYGEIRGAPQLRYGLDGTTSTTAFLLRSGSSQERTFRIQAEGRSDGVVAIAVSARETTDYLLVNEGGPRQPCEGFGIVFRGKLLWLRTQHGKPVELRVVHGGAVSSARFGLEVLGRPDAKALHVYAGSDALQVWCGAGELAELNWAMRPCPQG